MFLAILTLTAFVVVFIKRDDKRYQFLFLVVMWLLFAFSSGNADTEVYQRRYYHPETERLEPLFGAIVWSANWLNLTYQQFLMIVAVAFLASLYIFINKWGGKSSVPLLLYAVFPFCIDVVQVRNTLAFVPILIGARYLLEEDKSADIKYLIAVLISTLIHSSGLFYGLLLIAKRCNLKTVFIFTTFAVMTLALVPGLNEAMVAIAAMVGVDQRVKVILDYSKWLDPEVAIGTMRSIVMVFGLSATSLAFSLFAAKKAGLNLDERAMLALKASILLLLLVPLTRYSVDLFRIQRYLLIIVYASVISQGMNLGAEQRPLNVPFYRVSYCLLWLLAFGALYVQVIRPGLVESVIYPLFFCNKLVV